MDVSGENSSDIHESDPSCPYRQDFSNEEYDDSRALIPNPFWAVYGFSYVCGLSETTDNVTEANVAGSTRGLTSTRTTLKYVFVLTRHGSRTPVSTYRTDPYPFTNLQYWPEGPGQLTKFGKRQLYQTGKALRRRYNSYLSINYYFNETAARSNVFDRDFMSAATLLAGLYPPQGYQLWNKRIPWQPIPIWEDRNDVADLYSSPQSCPRYTTALAKSLEVFNKDSFKNKRLLQYLSKYTQEKITYNSKVLELWDVFTMQQENGWELPDWAKAVYPDQMADLEARGFLAYSSGNLAMIRLAGGPLFEMIMNQLNMKSRGTLEPDRKLFIEAAHDVSLRVLLSGLGVQEVFPIDTSAYIIIELHDTGLEDLCVKVMYFNNSAATTPRPINIPSCGRLCTLSQFNSLLRRVIPDNVYAECQDLDFDQ